MQAVIAMGQQQQLSPSLLSQRSPRTPRTPARDYVVEKRLAMAVADLFAALAQVSPFSAGFTCTSTKSFSGPFLPPFVCVL